MLDDPADRPGQWRKRGDELRAIADQFSKSVTARSDLLKLADQWDEMAEREDGRRRARRL